ncbi:MAG: HipA domain-containing protein [Fusobacteriaceae bacterium]|nr:HipA domain-containing protein [Fusobacteriaceae bacterium]
MHKNIPTVDLEIDSNGFIYHILKIHDEKHLPPGISTAKNTPDRDSLNEWLRSRSIPASRMGIQEVLEKLSVKTPEQLITKCFGLSLSDQYWLSPKGSGLKWENINFFTNPFSTDVGNILFGQDPRGDRQIDLLSPDNTSDGWLQKKWIIQEGRRCLIKGGSAYFKQEPYNEVIAGEIMKRLGIPHVEYRLIQDQGVPFCVCDNFVTAETELIPAARVKDLFKRNNSDSRLTHFLKCCDILGIPDVASSLDQMLALDFLISNEDRHFHNFGFLRKAETLEWIGMAPIYDSGTSLWLNAERVGQSVQCKPFRKTHDEQIALVKDFSRFDPERLSDIEEVILSTFSSSRTIPAERQKDIVAAVKVRILRLEKMAGR